jgi:CubicO group peptidase (beta-lactamase class C family)
VTREVAAELLGQGVKDKVFPGAALAWGDQDRFDLVCVGRLWDEAAAPRVGPETLFDIASLTKPLATTAVVRNLVLAGWGSLDDPLGDSVPGCRRLRATLRRLLTHTSGLPPYLEEPWKRGGADAVWAAVARLADEAEPSDRPVYSCLGFVVLMKWAEAMSGQSFPDLLRWAAPGLVCRLSPEDRVRAAPTGPVPLWRGKAGWIQGEVHDPLAWTLGGVGGNAGCFGTVAAVAQAVQRSWRAPAEWKSLDRPSGRGLGWDFVPQYFYHYGFTGCGVWIKPASGCFAVLLSNRTHFGDDRAAFVKFRSRLERRLDLVPHHAMGPL